MTALALQTRTSPSFAAAAAATACLTETRSPLAMLGTISRFDRNSTIFSEGDDAAYSYKVITGAVRLSKIMSDGRRQIAEFAFSSRSSVGVPKYKGRRGSTETCETAMVEPISNPKNRWENGSNQDRSQASSF